MFRNPRRGYAIPLFILFFIISVFLAFLTIDLGFIRLSHRKLQTEADFEALEAVRNASPAEATKEDSVPFNWAHALTPIASEDAKERLQQGTELQVTSNAKLVRAKTAGAYQQLPGEDVPGLVGIAVTSTSWETDSPTYLYIADGPHVASLGEVVTEVALGDVSEYTSLVYFPIVRPSENDSSKYVIIGFGSGFLTGGTIENASPTYYQNVSAVLNNQPDREYELTELLLEDHRTLVNPLQAPALVLHP